MPSEFDLPDLLVPQEKSILSISDTLDKLLLAASLDLFKHLAATSLDLLTTYTFVNLKEFRHGVASDRAYLLNLLACMINQDVAIYNRVLIKYGKKKSQKQAKQLKEM